ncbi:HBL/NHE enterotoxin family protein [Streptomyces sp. NPDC007861]|uniref:HBL/NHE enterotoxin family protein n=1 Tax=Streptomyces sp. NPDC007861 TaxID=3154893 RepID=UPI0033FBD6B0
MREMYFSAVVEKKPETSLDTDGALAKQSRATAGSRVLVDTYTTAVLEQKDVVFDSVKGLPDVQKNAKEHASEWRDSVSPALISVNTDLMTFANSFTSYYAPLQRMAEDIKNPDSRNNFIKGMQLLVGKIDGHQKNSADALKKLNTLNDHILGDHRDFEGISTQVKSKITGDNGQLPTLEDLEESLKKAMNKDLTIIATSATAVVVGGLMIVTGLLAEIPTAGGSTPLILAGVAVAGAGIAGTTMASIDYANKKKELSDTITKIADVKSDLAVLKGLQATYGSLSESSSDATKCLTIMSNTWTQLGTQFNNIITELRDSEKDDSIWLTANLDAAHKDWTDLHATASLIAEQTGQMKVVPGGLNQAPVSPVSPVSPIW